MKYAVVRDKDDITDAYHGYKSGNYTFSTFHSTLEEAKAEAERLCRKEGVPFLVLQVISKISLFKPEPPVEWEEV